MNRLRKSICIFLSCYLLSFFTEAGFPQDIQPGFHHLTPAEGLSNSSSRCIAEDKYGFIWTGTVNGLNRYDGNQVLQYLKSSNPFSVSSSVINSLLSDAKGRLWVGCDTGLCCFDYETDRFNRYNSSGLSITKIATDRKGNIWLATPGGLKIVDTIKKLVAAPSIFTDTALGALLKLSIRDINCGPNGQLCMATAKGVLVINPDDWKWKLYSANLGNSRLPGDNVFVVTFDRQNRIWAGIDAAYSTLCCISTDRQSVRVFDYFKKQDGNDLPNFIRVLYSDNKNRIWVGSTYKGLTYFDESHSNFQSYLHQPDNPGSFSTNSCAAIAEDKNGILWLGTEGEGVDFFHPDRQIFTAIRPGQHNLNSLPHNWARAIAVDGEGRYWLATANAVSVYKPGTGIIRNFANDGSEKPGLKNHSVRALLYDDNGFMWIGTASGLNRYNFKSGQMRSYSADAQIPDMFVHFIKKLQNGTIIIGGNRGLFAYQDGTEDFMDLRSSSPRLGGLISGSIKAFREDRNGLWWIGTFSNGVVVYDPFQSEIVKILNADSGQLCNNYIQSFREDSTGNMWIGTRGGLAKYNLASNKIDTYDTDNGLPNAWICGMLFDQKGRLWIGTDDGLCVMNGAGKVVYRFGIADGLSTTQFNDQEAYELPGGLFVFPSRKGFIFFNPLHFNWSQAAPPVYIARIHVSGEGLFSEKNLETLQQLSLRYQQNFFSIDLNAINYLNPGECWYAYKLDGFDKDWVYSKTGVATYTNVPGGKYIFRYKASSNQADWKVVEKQVAISIDTVFYKTTWFLLVLILTVATVIYAFYRFRLHKQRLIFSLQTKTATLQKEKAQVQYDNLKQQLNPHFLFNSLSSLRGLIRMKQDNATTFLDGLSQTYRYLLRSRDSDLVPLADEISFLKSYMQLQQVRFEEGLVLHIDIPDDLMSCLVAPVTIQGLIENAIKHNKIDESSPLVICIQSAPGNYLEVRNNLQRYTQVETSNKKGLEALQQLYFFYTDRKIVAGEEDGYFVVRIPLL